MIWGISEPEEFLVQFKGTELLPFICSIQTLVCKDSFRL
jgi:hypothetical protein